MNTPSRLDDRRPFHSILFFASTFFPRIFSPSSSSLFSPIFDRCRGKACSENENRFDVKNVGEPCYGLFAPDVFLFRIYSGLVLGLSLRDIRVSAILLFPFSLFHFTFLFFELCLEREIIYFRPFLLIFISRCISILVTYRYNIIIFLFLLINVSKLISNDNLTYECNCSSSS